MATQLNGKPPVQDMPPPGGFKDIERRVSGSRVHGATIFAGVTLVCMWGFYGIGQGNIIRRERRVEKRKVRAAILPFIQAEEDVRYVREHAAVIDHERKVMANVPGWVAGESVYHGGSWQAPGYTRFV